MDYGYIPKDDLTPPHYPEFQASYARERRAGLIASVLLFIGAVTFAVFAIASVASADDYQCTKAEGCIALLPSPGGTKTIKFLKGDIVSTSSGFIVNPRDGWDAVSPIPGCAYMAPMQ